MLNRLAQELKAFGFLLVVGFLLLVAGWGIGQCGHPPLVDNTPIVEELASTKTELVSLRGLLAKQNEETQRLRELIGSLKGPVKYVVTEKVVLVGKEETLPHLPDNYTYLLNNKIPVAHFGQGPEGYTFKSYDLDFTTDVAISDRDTVAQVRVHSSGDGKTYEVPSKVVVRKIRQQKFFEPHIGLGVSGSAPDWSITGSIFSPLLHPTEDIDLVSLRVSGSDKHAYIGLDPIGYNLGKPLPVFTDLWVYGGVSTGVDLHPQATITLGSKL